MGEKLIDHCVSVITINKNKKLYGMSCAWIMQCDYTRFLCLLGSQSTTGSVIEVGDIIGVSILNKNQKDVAINFGENHSNETDKFKNINYFLKDDTPLIYNAKICCLCKVKEVLHLHDIEEDNLLYLDVLETIENVDQEFLHMSNI